MKGMLFLIICLHVSWVGGRINALSSTNQSQQEGKRNSNYKYNKPLESRSWLIPSGLAFGDLERLVLKPSIEEEEEEETHEEIEKDDVELSKDEDDVIVATRAIGLNFADVFTILGYYKAANLVREKPATKQKKSHSLKAFVPGLEFSGIVTQVPSSTPDSQNGKEQHDKVPPLFAQGDRVFGFTRFGAYSDTVEASPQVIRKLPSNWTYEQGAAFLVNALTAWHGLVAVAGLPDKDFIAKQKNPYLVLVHSASGGVGLWASEIAARRGALVVGVVGTDNKVDTFIHRIQPLCPSAQCIVRSSDAKQFVIDLANAVCQARATVPGSIIPKSLCFDKNSSCPSSAEDIVKEGWGVDVVMESYGGKYFQPSLNMINAGGSLATYGSTSYNGSGGNKMAFLPLVLQYLRRPRIDPGELTGRNIRVGGFNLIFLTERTEALSHAFDEMVECLNGGTNGGLESVSPPVVGKTYNFATEMVEALRALRSGTTVGKVVLSNTDNPTLK